MTLAEAVPSPTLGKITMEDRKRPSLSEDDLAPPPKRQATTNGAKKASDAELPGQDDIDRYQKDAILRQMKEYKREKSLIEQTVAEMSKRSMYHDDHLRIIDNWFTQLLDEIVIMAKNLDTMDTSTSEDVPFQSSLSFESHEKFKEHLSSRSEKIKDAIKVIFSKFPVAPAEARDLQSRLSSLLAAEKVHLTELQSLSSEKGQLEERLEKACHRYMLAEKKYDRSRSATVQKLERQATYGNRNELGTGGNGSPNMKQESVNGVLEDGILAAEAESARREAVAASQKRKDQLESLEAENRKLTEEVTANNIRFASLSAEDYAKTDLFKLAKSQLEDLVKRINDLEAINIQLREEAQKLQTERSSYRERVEEETRRRIAESEVDLARAELDLSRIRGSRDELQADQAIRRATESQQRTAEAQMKELVDIRQDRIITLESEVEKLQLKLGDQLVNPELIAALDSKSPDELKAETARVSKEYDILKQQLTSIEAAYRKSHAMAQKKVSDTTSSEELVARSMAEKAKADQKYFGTMKAKELRDAENRTLRNQNAKSSEIISSLKENAAAKEQLADKLEKQLTETKDLLNNLTTQQRQAQQKLNEHGFSSENTKSQIDELKKHITGKDAAALAASEARRKAEVEKEELKVRLEETKKDLETWKKRGLGNQSEEEEMLRTLAICTICRVNFKNSALKTCGHVFCQECVNDRLNVRMRKCPNCGRGFGANDYMRVTL
ncbi:MAG: E3 ubiquitin-protein ligase bre1 [Bogoriella megaspora]|nr:MAG: E3 ubiquitin-protein ligase bre1 [Bogoriella megaspora]